MSHDLSMEVSLNARLSDKSLNSHSNFFLLMSIRTISPAKFFIINAYAVVDQTAHAAPIIDILICFIIFIYYILHFYN